MLSCLKVTRVCKLTLLSVMQLRTTTLFVEVQGTACYGPLLPLNETKPFTFPFDTKQPSTMPFGMARPRAGRCPSPCAAPAPAGCLTMRFCRRRRAHAVTFLSLCDVDFTGA